MLEHEVIFNTSGWITLTELCRKLRSEAEGNTRTILPLRQVERNYIRRVLAQTDNNKSLAARLLGITRTTLRNKLDNDAGGSG